MGASGEERGAHFMTDKAIVDSLTLRFVGEDENGVALHELRAAHVAEVLQGLVGLTSDFDKAGAFHAEGPADSEVLVRPAKDGSFLIEVVRVVTENWDIAKTVAAGAGAAGVPSLSSIIWYLTRSRRADVKDFSYLANGNVKVTWQDDTAEEISAAVWKELQKSPRRRKKQLRQIMAPLADSRVTELDVAAPAEAGQPAAGQDESPQKFMLKRADYDAVRPEDEIKEKTDTFDVEAQMSAIDFDDPTRWRVKTKERTRTVTVEDEKFLGQVARGLAIHPKDIFSLRIREDATVKNGRTRTKWAVVDAKRVRRAPSDNESQEHSPPSA